MSIYQQQLWPQCLPLTHHSLQAFLLSIIERPHIYNLHQFLKHPQIGTVDKKVLELFMLFVEGTWGTVEEGVRKQMAKGKVEKLRKLTVLALFEGMHEVPLATICTAIDTTRQETIDMLIEMSIAGTIQIKINEQTSLVSILYSEIRGRSFSNDDTKLLQGKITNILQKNKRVLKVVDEAFSQIRNGRDGSRVGSPIGGNGQWRQ